MTLRFLSVKRQAVIERIKDASAEMHDCETEEAVYTDAYNFWFFMDQDLSGDAR